MPACNGTDGDDIFIPLAGRDNVIGLGGWDTLNGGSGGDTLTGGAAADLFAFTVLPGTGAGTITDFLSDTDKIQFDDAVFTTLGGFGANAFVTGTAAGDADDRIIYDNTTGQLFYDANANADGNGTGLAVLFATLQGNPALALSDFQVI